MGKVAINKIECVTNQQINSIIPFNKFNSDFIYYVLSSMQEYLRNLATGGSTMPIVNKSSFEDIIISIPDLPTQTAIAEILSSLDDKIELNNKINQELENLAQALFKQWFIDFEFPVSLNHDSLDLHDEQDLKINTKEKNQINYKNQGNQANPKNQGSDTYRSSGGEMVESELGEIPKGWEVCNLSDLLTVKYGKDHKHLADGPFPLYGSGGIMRYVEQPLYSEPSILIPRKGTLSNLFYVSEPFWSVDTMFYTIIHNPLFGKYLFLSIKALNLASMNVGSAVPSMTTQVLNEIRIIKPTESVMVGFDNQVSSFFELLNHNIFENQELTNLRDTLLPKLISGELEVNGLNRDFLDLLDEKDFKKNAKINQGSDNNQGNQDNPKNQG